MRAHARTRVCARACARTHACANVKTIPGYSVVQVINATAELQKGVTFNTIRLMKVLRVQSDTLLDDLTVDIQWTAPTQGGLVFVVC